MKRAHSDGNVRPIKKKKFANSRPKAAVLSRITELTENNSEFFSPAWIDLVRSPTKIGRDSNQVDIIVANFPDEAGTLKDPVHIISRLHGEFLWAKERWSFINHGTNGTILQRGPATHHMTRKKLKNAALKSGDTLVFGREILRSKKFGSVHNVCQYEFRYAEELEPEPDIDVSDAMSRLRLAEQKEQQRKEEEATRLRELKIQEKEERLERDEELILRNREELKKQQEKIAQQKQLEEERRRKEAERRQKDEQLIRQKSAAMEEQEAKLRAREESMRAERERLDKERVAESAKLLKEKQELEAKEAKLAKQEDSLEKEKKETTVLREKELAEIRKQKAELEKKLQAEMQTLKEFNCPICLDITCAPVSLNCGHTFCEHCIDAWLKSQAQSNCPQCRKAFTHRTSVSTQIKNIIEAALEFVGDENLKEEYEENKEKHALWKEEQRRVAQRNRQRPGRGRGGRPRGHFAIRGGGRRGRNHIIHISDDESSSEDESEEEESSEEESEEDLSEDESEEEEST